MGDVLNLLNLNVLLSSLIGFLVLWWVTRKFLFPPVLKIIDERKESIERAFAEVDQARADVAQMKTDYEARMAQISAEAQGKMQESIEKGQQLAAEIRQAAEDQRDKLLARTAEDIEREKQKAIAELRSEAIDLSFRISERVLRDGLDRQQHDKLVAQFVDDLKRVS